MTSSNGTPGRPPIGRPVSITLPEEVIDALDEQAKRYGVTRSDVARDVLATSLLGPSSPARREVESLRSREAGTVARVLAAWIARKPGSREGVKDRYMRFVKASRSGAEMVRLTQQALAELLLAGAEDLVPPAVELMVRLGERHEWKLRTDVFTATTTRLVREGLMPAQASTEEELAEMDEALGGDYA